MSMKSTLELDDKQYDQAITKAAKSPQKLQDGFNKLGNFLGGGLIVAGLEKVVATADEFGDVAGRFKVSAEELQRFGVAGERTGTSLESVAKGLAKMKQNGMAADEMYNLADAVKAATTENEEFAIAEKAVGSKLASELLPMLRLGGEAMREMGKSAAVMDEETVKALSAANDEIFTLKQQFMVTFGKIASLLLQGTKGVKIWGAILGGQFYFVSRIATEAGGIIKDAFTGNFEAAKKSAMNFGKFTKDTLREALTGTIETMNEINAVKEEAPEVVKEQGERPEDQAKRLSEEEKEAAKAAADKLKTEENIAKLKEDLAKKEKEAAESQLKLKDLIAKKEEEAADARAWLSMITDEEARLEKLIEVVDLEKEIRDLKKTAQEEQEKADQERHDKLAAIGEKEADLAEAQLNAVKAQADLVQASLDRASSTLAELAQGGQNGHSKAQRAMRWEERAKERKARGDDEGAAKALSKADKLRGELGGLSAADQNPMKAMTEALSKQTVEVTTIKDDLARLIAALGSGSS